MLKVNFQTLLNQDEDEEIDEDDVSDSGIQPPCYTPPEIPTHLLPPEKVVVTQPTPEIEHAEEEIVPENESEKVSEATDLKESEPETVSSPKSEVTAAIGTNIYLYYTHTYVYDN